jgi:transposase
MLATLLSATAVYVVAEPCDLRKSIDGLALAVETSLATSPVSGSVFAFFNRGRDKVKLLWWDRHGFWLAYKRLERGQFRKPLDGAISRAELLLLLEGVDLAGARFREVRAGRVGRGQEG